MEGNAGIVESRGSLLLCATEPWASAVRSAAATLPDIAIENAASAHAAVRRLTTGEAHISHLLVEPGFAGAMLGVLADLTAGEPGSGTSLVLLGNAIGDAARPGRSRGHVVASATGNWLADALAADADLDAAQKALSADELRDALAGARIVARYQPIVRMADRVPLCLEVLARLDHPTRGTLSPDLFVPPMERAGLAWPLTEMVVRRAFADWGHGALIGLGLSIALNFPLDVLLIPSALSWLETQREMAGIPAASIVIELTESQPIIELARLGQATARLCALGYGLAIDDVGMNVRDYRALLDLPFSTLKLDRNLVRDSAASNTAHDFLSRTLESARAAGLRVVAEGIQDAAIWRRMAGLGVDQAQGFLVGRPLPVEAVPIWLKGWRDRHLARPPTE